MANLSCTARWTKAARAREARPSVREVCLLGVLTPLSEGERLTWSGRAYRVEASHPGYAHLSAEPDGAEMR